MLSIAVGTASAERVEESGELTLATIAMSLAVIGKGIALVLVLLRKRMVAFLGIVAMTRLALRPTPASVQITVRLMSWAIVPLGAVS